MRTGHLSTYYVASTGHWAYSGGSTFVGQAWREYLEMWYKGRVGRMQGAVGVCNRVAQFLLGRRSESDF